MKKKNIALRTTWGLEIENNSETYQKMFVKKSEMFLKEIRNVFGVNLKQLLVASPVKMRTSAGF